jgi:hypothetical protein
MGKKEKKKKEKTGLPKSEGGLERGRGENAVGSPPLVGRRGWKIIFSGIFLLLIGFVILSLADSPGQNWASNLSPILIIGGYALIGFGIIAKDPA